ncbi:MAG: eight-cysteine-cluster domain-containing protein [Candidatus Aenigmarchaeota archaeon]|nr:eight-cysteine-cluster domain-containing protein [Candidatus Aenigmarchaeota archaeon]
MKNKIFYGILVTCILIIVGVGFFMLIKPAPMPILVTKPILNYNVGGCEKQEEREYIRARGVEERVDVEVVDGFINLIHHLNYVCCANMKVYLDSSESFPEYTLIKIKEKNEGEMCRCICDYEISIKIGPLEKGKYLIQIWGVEFENMSAELLWEKELEMKEVTTLPLREEFCGWSTNGRCLTDFDCVKGGCSGQVCQSKYEEPVITICEWRDCYNAIAYGLECKCINQQCQWA